MLKINVWSDFDCPYCYISKHQLAQVLAEEGVSEYDLIMWPYQLMPEKISEPDRTFLDAQEIDNPQDLEDAKNMLRKIEELGRTVGLDMNLFAMRSVNTLDAHRLCLWAREQDPQKAALLIEKIADGQFCKGADISNHQQLLDYAESSGLDRALAAKVLASDAYRKEMSEYEDRSFEDDIELIPHYYFPGGLQLSGIPPISHMKQIVHKALHPEQD